MVMYVCHAALKHFVSKPEIYPCQPLRVGPAFFCGKGMHHEGYTTRSQTHVASWGYLSPGTIDNDTV